MGGNVLYTPALQAPISLSNPAGQLLVASDTGASQGKSVITPTQGGVLCSGNPNKYGLLMPTAPGAMGVASDVPRVVSRLVTPRQSSSAIVLVIGISPIVSAPPPASNAVKFRAGHYFWFNNSQWGTLAVPGAEQTAFVNSIAALSANPNVRGIEIYLRQKDLETTPGNYAVCKQNLDFIFNTIRNQPQTRKLCAIIAVMDRDYGGGTPSASTATWPQYMINNGWAIPGPTGGNGTLSILNYNNSSAISAFSAAINRLCLQYNNEPLLEMVMVGTETSDPYSGAGAWTAAAYLNGLKTVYSSVAPQLPNTLLRIPINFLSFQTTQQQDILNIYAQMRSIKRGGWIGGGPDPEIVWGYTVDAIALFRGATVNGVHGTDLRVTVPWCPEMEGPVGYYPSTQQVFDYSVGKPVGALTGTYSNGTLTGPTSGASISPPNWQPIHAWHIVWRYGDTVTDGIAFINANGPTTLPGVPSEGTWNTT